MKMVLISPKNRTVYNFRGDLIKKFIENGYSVVVTGPDESDIEKILALNVKFEKIPMNKNGTSIIGDIKYCCQLLKLMKREKPDVTLGYTIKPVVYGSIASWLAGVKNINSLITGGGYTFTAKTFKAKLLGLIVRALYKLGLKCSTHVIFQNKDDQDEFVKQKLVNADNCSVVNGSGVNTHVFDEQPFPEKLGFFMLSRLLKSKGVNEYLEAVRLVKAVHPEVEFSILGKYETDMQDAISKEELEAMVRDRSIVRLAETDNVKPYYAQCSVYVLPSYREGMPRTVLEAMSVGRPVITTDAHGCKDTIENGVSGFLVPVGDSMALAEKIRWFIENKEMIEQMGKAARKLCVEKFDVEKVNKNMLEIIGVGVSGDAI